MRQYYRVTVTLYDTPLLDGAVVDRARPFIADALTPLYYTRIWRELSDAQRLTYNQLNGIYWNELIAAFERHLALALLSSEVAPWVRELTREEILHEAVFHDLNRLAGAPRRFISIPAIASATLRGLARTRGGAAALVWVMMLMEERSIAVMSMTNGIETTFARVFAAHVADERGHVATDVELLSLLHRGSITRWVAALLFRLIVSAFFIGPGRGARAVVDALIDKHSELRPMRRRILVELRALRSDPRYHAMLYDREKVPQTFALFDKHREMRFAAKPLRAYVLRGAPAAPPASAAGIGGVP
jgi:hypothetical protein